MENEKETKQQLDVLNKYEYKQTCVWAGINAIGEFVALKPIVENLGLSWPAQLRVIRNDPKMNQLLLNMAAVGADGKSREMVCMNHNDFNEWLWALNPKSENFRTELWESYKKGLVIFILSMLKRSLNYLETQQPMIDSFLELRKLNTQKTELEIQYAENQENGRTLKAEIVKTQREIDSILSKNPNQLVIPL